MCHTARGGGTAGLPRGVLARPAPRGRPALRRAAGLPLGEPLGAGKRRALAATAGGGQCRAPRTGGLEEVGRGRVRDIVGPAGLCSLTPAERVPGPALARNPFIGGRALWSITRGGRLGNATVRLAG